MSGLSGSERIRWTSVAESDGWDIVGTDALYSRAVEAIAWELIEQTMDTADRGPSPEDFREATATAYRLLDSLRTPEPTS